jgi:hypothetical protein
MDAQTIIRHIFKYALNVRESVATERANGRDQRDQSYLIRVLLKFARQQFSAIQIGYRCRFWSVAPG